MNKKLNNLITNGELKLNNLSKLSQNNFANIFNVVNKGKKSYFNLCKNIKFNNIDSINSSYYSMYLVLDNDCWTNISYKMYGTIELWWLIAKFNNVKNPFTELTAGSYIKIPGDEIKDIVLSRIREL